MVRAWPAESRWLLAQQRPPGTPAEPVEAPQRPALQEVSPFMWLEREVELEYRPRMLQAAKQGEYRGRRAPRPDARW